MSTRLHIVVSEELLARIDAAKGVGQPRADWIRRAVEQALASRRLGDLDMSFPSSPAPAEQPDTRAMDLLREDDPDPDFIARGRVQEFPPSYRQTVPGPTVPGPNVEGVRSSAQAKRDVLPVPKRGEKK